MRYIGIVAEKAIKHYGHLGMKWYQHIFGDDPRWGRNGRAKGKYYGHQGAKFETPIGTYDTEDRSSWSNAKETMREAYYQDLDKKYPLSKLKNSNDKLSQPPTLDEVQKLSEKVNPNKNHMNCVKCAVSTILRFKGYDAVAYEQENGLGHPSTVSNKFFSEAKAIDLNGARRSSATFPITKYPSANYKNPFARRQIQTNYKAYADALNRGLKDGEYGIIASESTRGGNGHALNFIKLDGRLYAIDSQIARVEPIEDYFDSVGWYVNSHELVICSDRGLTGTGVGRFVDKKQFKK